ncbi:gamma-glutamyltransferase [Streptomyces canarius]
MVPGAGALAAAVPGAVDAWASSTCSNTTAPGNLPMSSTSPSTMKNGHPVLGRVVGTIERVQELFTEHWPTSAAQWMPEGQIPKTGDLVFNRPYAEVLRRLVR